ncbi:MAG: hypothetical protein ABS882_03520 [Lysinibacillus sp.]
MNLLEFQELSKRTMPFGGEPKNQIEFENMLGNYAMGLVGEWFEFQTVTWKAERDGVTSHDAELKKEAGDIMHYAFGLLTILNHPITEIEAVEKIDYEELDIALSNILEIPKKHIYHRHELQPLELIRSVCTVIRVIRTTFDKHYESILDTNIEKLKTRYPAKFNTADSIARVDTVEGKE